MAKNVERGAALGRVEQPPNQDLSSNTWKYLSASGITRVRP
jgi:hypothetical protein